jgi:hypothetical protein
MVCSRYLGSHFARLSSSSHVEDAVKYFTMAVVACFVNVIRKLVTGLHKYHFTEIVSF